jgi:hypothetical protein
MTEVQARGTYPGKWKEGLAVQEPQEGDDVHNRHTIPRLLGQRVPCSTKIEKHIGMSLVLQDHPWFSLRRMECSFCGGTPSRSVLSPLSLRDRRPVLRERARVSSTRRMLFSDRSSDCRHDSVSSPAR